VLEQARIEKASRQLVNVVYATHRVIDHPGIRPIPLEIIAYKRSRTLRFGSAIVRISDTHLIGVVELPTDLTILGLTILRAKEDEKKHFTLKEVRLIDKDELVHARAESGALVFVHGYNTSFDDAVFKTAQIAYDARFPGVPVAFVWPSLHSLTAYDYDRESASFSTDALLELHGGPVTGSDAYRVRCAASVTT
jgi:esterase/lipase superfamily enzyme